VVAAGGGTAVVAEWVEAHRSLRTVVEPRVVAGDRAFVDTMDFEPVMRRDFLSTAGMTFRCLFCFDI
jgi:hypothetical protein